MRLTLARLSLSGLLVAAHLVWAAAAPAPKVSVFILAGQSNMDGRGSTAELSGPLAVWATPQRDVRLAYSNSTKRGAYTSGGFVPLQPGYSVKPGVFEKEGKSFTFPGTTFGPEVSFGRTLAEALPKERIALIKFSEGGTSLSIDWAPDNADGVYPQCLAFVRQALKTLRADGDLVELSGVVWHQGESDFKLPPGEYRVLLKGFIARLRKDLNSPDLPFIVGEVFDNGQRNGVRADQLAVSKSVPATLFVASVGLHTRDQGTHFDTPSQIELGQRMARAWLKEYR